LANNLISVKVYTKNGTNNKIVKNIKTFYYYSKTICIISQTSRNNPPLVARLFRTILIIFIYSTFLSDFGRRIKKGFHSIREFRN